MGWKFIYRSRNPHNEMTPGTESNKFQFDFGSLSIAESGNRISYFLLLSFSRNLSLEMVNPECIGASTDA